MDEIDTYIIVKFSKLTKSYHDTNVIKGTVRNYQGGRVANSEIL